MADGPEQQTGYIRSPLQLGMCGEDVRLLQENMNKLGIQVPVNGTFGPETEAGVKEMQLAARLQIQKYPELSPNFQGVSRQEMDEFVKKELPPTVDATEWSLMELAIRTQGQQPSRPNGTNAIGSGVPSVEESHRDSNAVYNFFRRTDQPPPGSEACFVAKNGSGSGLSAEDSILYASLRNQLPASVSNEKVAEAAVHAAENGILTPDKVRSVVVQNDRIHVEGTTPGFRASVDLTKPAPSAEEVNVRLAAVNQPNNTQEAHQTQSENRSHGARAFG